MKLENEVLILKKEIKFLKNELNKYKYDYLTGLPGRIDFEKDFDNFMNDFKLFNKTFILGIIDINNLHKINRIEGYNAGDALILSVSNKLEKILNKSNIYRIGGDEFAVLCRNENEDSFCNKLITNDINNDITFAVISSYDKNMNKKTLFEMVDDMIIEKKKLSKRGRRIDD